jgi:hypothetical protein
MTDAPESTVTIVERHNAHERATYTYTCVACQSMLTARPMDGLYYDGANGRGVRVVCPVCGAPRRLALTNFVIAPIPIKEAPEPAQEHRSKRRSVSKPKSGSPKAKRPRTPRKSTDKKRT